jgi:hypothetical protein
MTRRQRQQRNRGQLAEATPPDHQREERGCARGDYCQEATVRWVDDRREAVPKRGPRAFCDTDTREIASALVAFPRQYATLRADLTELRSAQANARPVFGPRLPIPADIDAATRQLRFSVGSWQDRVLAVPGITIPPPAEDADPDEKPDATEVRDAVRLLHRNLGALLALDDALMIRHMPIPPRADKLTPTGRDDYLPSGQLAPRRPGVAPIPDHVAHQVRNARLIRIGVDSVTVEGHFDGAAAGLEILRLHYRCRVILGEVEPRPENLPGVACYKCGHKALRRADPPPTDSEVLYYSQCKVCGHQMTEPAYRTHLERLAALERGPRTTLEALSDVMEARRRARAAARGNAGLLADAACC